MADTNTPQENTQTQPESTAPAKPQILVQSVYDYLPRESCFQDDTYGNADDNQIEDRYVDDVSDNDDDSEDDSNLPVQSILSFIPMDSCIRKQIEEEEKAKVTTQ